MDLLFWKKCKCITYTYNLLQGYYSVQGWAIDGGNGAAAHGSLSAIQNLH
jgi:hypothetical protein